MLLNSPTLQTLPHSTYTHNIETSVNLLSATENIIHQWRLPAHENNISKFNNQWHWHVADDTDWRQRTRYMSMLKPGWIYCATSSNYFYILYTFYFSQWEFLPWEIRVAFSQKSQLQQSHYPALINYKVHGGSFHVSIIHKTLTWTIESLSWFNVRTQSFLCVRKHMGVGQHFWLGKTLTNFYCAPDADGIQPSGLCLDALPTEQPVM